MTGLSNTLWRAWRQYFVPLCTLNRIQFSAPWVSHRRPC